jgi:hypothetical protein
VAGLAAVEGVCWYCFHYTMPARVRRAALFAVHGQAAEGGRRKVPVITPYLWANYRPNPRSPKANEHGWRYGGGPKKVAYRILCLGGSTTWSTGAGAPDRSYPARMESYLREKGHALDVVNGGCLYFTSAELVGTLAFRGVYERPDLVVLHTGGNDAAPLISPRGYRPDYTHWRTVDPTVSVLSDTDRFRAYWSVPSWTVRYLLARRLRPDPFDRRMVARQLTTGREGLLAQNDVSGRSPVGLETNLRSLVAIARGHGAKVVLVTFAARYERLGKLLPALKTDAALQERVTARARAAMAKTNEAIARVARECAAPLIPFHEFRPASPDVWTDHCHLDDRGCAEKAAFIGDRLISLGLLPGGRKDGT